MSETEGLRQTPQLGLSDPEPRLLTHNAACLVWKRTSGAAQCLDVISAAPL